MPSKTTLDRYITAVRPRYEDLLGQMVEIPSISMDPAHARDMRRMGTLAVEFMRAMGAEARLVSNNGYPVVSGGWRTGRGHPTITIYNHLDVQPAQEPEWRHAPFAFQRANGIYRGRGTTDDKGPALAALFASRYVVEQGLPVNVRFLWELEEEIGSPNLAAALAKTNEIPRPDCVVVSDTIWVSRERPAMPSGLRGLVAAKVSVRTGEVGVHSGVTGGAARNPLAELCALVERCLDVRTGRVRIPGFYDDVLPVRKPEIDGFLKSGFNTAHFMHAHQLRALRTMDPREIVRRIWAAPTFEVHGLVGGYTGPGVKTVVPAWGELKVSMRLVPDQRPERIFRLFKQFIRAHNPDAIVELEGRLRPFRGVTQGPYAAAARHAMRAGFGKEPALVREGGSIGAVSMMADAWNVPILFMGLSLPEHGYHAPNEYFDWRQASGGVRAFVRYLEDVARMKKPGR